MTEECARVREPTVWIQEPTKAADQSSRPKQSPCPKLPKDSLNMMRVLNRTKPLTQPKKRANPELKGMEWFATAVFEPDAKSPTPTLKC